MNMYTSEIALEEIEMSMKNAKKTVAFVPSLWESLSKRDKRKFSQVMTEPIILPSADDGGWLPEWMFKSLEKERLARALGRKQELCELASNLEVASYLMCGTFHSPISEQACRIYFHAASTLSSALEEVMKAEGIIDNEPLSQEDQSELRTFKKWIRAKQKNSKNGNKISRFVSVWDGALFELKNADLLMLESQI